MGWFGRKSAPDMRPFVPAWLKTDEQPGFARSYDAQFEEVYRRNPVGQRDKMPSCRRASLALLTTRLPERLSGKQRLGKQVTSAEPVGARFSLPRRGWV